MSVSSFTNIPLKDELIMVVSGSSNWTNKRSIGRYLDSLVDKEGYLIKNITVVHSDSKGADHHAAMEALGRGIKVKEYHTSWLRYGLNAVQMRNQQIFEESKPDRVVIFHEDFKKSKNSTDLVQRALAAKIQVDIILN